MKASNIVRLATSSALFALTTVGCASVTPPQLSSASSAPKPAKSVAKSQAQALQALAKGQNDKAIGFAEAAVLSDPDNPELRSLLGQAYMASGRFQSAGESFEEAMTLGRVDARNVIGLALAQTSQGEVGKARRLLETHRAMLPVADYGLAMALAGDSAGGVAVLIDAIRTDSASAKTRQNLALAYALDGRWREARILASQDMSADAVETRISSWAQMARPGAYQARVASLLGVAPVADVGRPIGLALDFSAPQTEMVASVQLPPSDTPLPAIGPAPRQGGSALFAAQETGVAMASAAAPAPVIAQPRPVAPADPVTHGPILQAPVIPAPAHQVRAAPVPVKLASATPTAGMGARRSDAPSMRGSHLVQLGAFSSPENAAKAWSIYQRKYPALKNYGSASARIAVKGRTLYRLAAMGFDDADSAARFCGGLRAEGGRCIVRNMRGQGAVQYAAGSMNGRVLASR